MNELVIAGGGFAGVWAAMSAAAQRRKLAAEDVPITLYGRDPWLTMRPRLYEGAREESRVALEPLMSTIGVRLEVSEIASIAPDRRQLSLADGGSVAYGRLVLATGSRLRPDAIPGADDHGLSVDTFEKSAAFDRRIAALPDTACLVVVGAGFTGLEVATEMRTRLGPKARIILADSADEPGAELGENPRPVIAAALAACAIETRLGFRIAEVTSAGVRFETGETLSADAVVVTTGLEASPLTRCFPGDIDSQGRLVTEEDLRLPGAPQVFAAGDTARALTDGIHPALMSCQHAMVLGRYAGHNAMRDLLGRETVPYRQEIYVTCLDLGPAGAMFTRGWDRQVEMTGDEAKSLKRQIMNERIYPPSPHIDAAEIFEAVALP